VKNYLANIFAKLNVTRRAQAAAVFAQESRNLRS
jgi:DNA-binding CsgD family transcriptional regulator